MTGRPGGEEPVAEGERWSGYDSAYLGDVVHAEPLSGGAAHDVRRVTLKDGTRLVVKASDRVPPDMFPIEAEGLAALREQGGLRTPDVIEVGPRHLLLEEVAPTAPHAPAVWEEAGRALARLHAISGTRFGWHRNGWLGLLRQRNDWSEDGCAFFAEQRILRYLAEPEAERALDPADRAGLTRLCERLPDLVPPAPAVLNHGDLWHGNLLATAQGEPVFIDPAVCWLWAESELSMAYCVGGIPEGFFAAYQELQPLSDGWQDRMPLYHLREHLSVLAHFGPNEYHVTQIRRTVRRFAG
ncbi:fructosamine kinase family protein [Kitasatospora sp. NBC_01250]|uniref:fructosamine kinase family protein n=1 Tax=unclassified Kitasatospora TaxID=2633591 RepID=UPI002E15865B|nr:MULTISPECIES: fructosamine kinase family protein [unclassified Kitasatospora]WSJ70851.1 fructosamine kinase family protein [Kitasatospora sp. NBC_01302]